MDTILKMVLDREVQTQDTNEKTVQNPRADDDEEALRKKRSIQTIGSGSYRVAFSAKNQLQMINVADHQKLIFDQVLTNIGGNYNAKTGLFQAEVSGAYLFFSDIGVMPNKDVSTGIVKDGTTLVQMYSQTPNVQGALESDSNMAIIHLNQGDSVWIEALQITDHSGAVMAGGCSFSGFLLYPDQ
ncbi:unnamed protein product [Mytilus edulis]|uniref:C1q domain-containing protein n=1 Tax=Mytilus edulis TaxID=6550 RepID=A0A8S3UXL0_MYTED|nr:unnamed protein product [Mytilus edulis]